MPKGASREIGSGEAAKLLGVSTQTVRNWYREGKVAGRTVPSGRLRLDEKSIEALVPSDAPEPTSTGSESSENTLDEVMRVLTELQERDLASARLLEAVERERDRFRAEASALREAALQLVSAASETDTGVRELLTALEHQREALVQLLAPGSPAGIE